MSVVVHTFNPSTLEAEACKSLSLRSIWSTEQVPEQPNLGSERNRRTQKDGEDAVEQRSHVIASGSSRTWQL